MTSNYRAPDIALFNCIVRYCGYLARNRRNPQPPNAPCQLNTKNNFLTPPPPSPPQIIYWFATVTFYLFAAGGKSLFVIPQI
jgi:hypothetical protein